MIHNSCNPYNLSDASGDLDNDGLNNTFEYENELSINDPENEPGIWDDYYWTIALFLNTEKNDISINTLMRVKRENMGNLKTIRNLMGDFPAKRYYLFSHKISC